MANKGPVQSAIKDLLSNATVPHDVDRVCMKLRKNYGIFVDDERCARYLNQMFDQGELTRKIYREQPHFDGVYQYTLNTPSR